jgi:phosphoserine phosphatase RsbU/P
MGNQSPPQILIIDDSAVDRMMLSAVLQKEGFPVLTATNGGEGMEKARANTPAIILLDVLMPDESGFDTCARLKSDPKTSKIPVIFLSASDTLESRVTGLTGGAVDYITKPFERAEVLARIRIHLRIRQAFDSLILQQQAQLLGLKKAQKAILVRPGQVEGANFAVFYRPVNAAGGDFYDVISQGNGITGYLIADIGGHDLGAAFITSALKVLLRQNFSILYTPHDTMMVLNETLNPVLREGVLLSACCARLNCQTGSMAIVSAGSPPIIHLKKNGLAELISAEGDLLGAFSAPYFESREIRVERGDRILFFTDGLIESHHGRPISRRQGLNALVQSAQDLQEKPLSDLVKELALSMNQASEETEDDILLLGVEI